jgi:hypothetical protein
MAAKRKSMAKWLKWQRGGINKRNGYGEISA